MIDLYDIRYVRLGTPDLDQATSFATQMVGLQLVRQEGRSTYLRSDSRDHTLCYFEGDPADQAIGFELKDPDGISSVAGQLDALNYPFRVGASDEAEQRRVAEFIQLRDPSGNIIEIVARPYESGVRYYGARDAGITGFNHIGLRTSAPTEDERFWTTVCNARVSDWIGAAPLLRLRTIHHTLALFPSKQSGVQHINHQVESIDDVMRAWYWLRERQVKIVFGPGRHPTSGAMFLYFEGPDGMVFEYSVGVGHIADEESHRPRQFPFEPYSICMWGARPEIEDLKA